MRAWPLLAFGVLLGAGLAVPVGAADVPRASPEFETIVYSSLTD